MKKFFSKKLIKTLLINGALLAAVTAAQSSLLLAQAPVNTSLGTITGSSGNIGVQNGMTNHVDININGARGYADWSSFNIQNNQSANFNFAGAGANGIILNRVNAAGGASMINGAINSNGHVIVQNQNGLTFGPQGNVNTKGFTGTTLNMTTSINDFMNGENNLRFQGNASSGSILVQNGAVIKATDGSVVLAGKTINTEYNSEILSPNGNVEMIAGRDYVVTHNAPGYAAISVGNSYLSNGAATTGINHQGVIESNAARLYAAGGNVYALAINNGGLIRATSIVAKDGRVYLAAAGGKILNSGTIESNGGVANTNAGRIEMKADEISIENGNVTAYGKKNGDNGIDLQADNVKLTSAYIATTDANININTNNNKAGQTGTHGSVTVGVDGSTPDIVKSAIVHAYGSGDVTVNTGTLALRADQGEYGRITVGARTGKTNVRTTSGDLTIDALNGGTAIIGYAYCDFDGRAISNKDATNWDLNFADLYVPTGDIKADVKGNLVINAVYNKNDIKHVPAAMIGHAFLPLEDASAFNKTDGIWNGTFFEPYQMRGNIDVRAQNVKLTSNNTANARIGHYANDFVYIDSSNHKQYLYVNGNIEVFSNNDITVDAKNGGNSGIGHIGNILIVPANRNPNGDLDYYYIKTTARNNTILNAQGERDSIAANGEKISSVAQIGHNATLEFKNPNAYNNPIPHLYGSIVSLSGTDLSLKNSIIGHMAGSIIGRKPGAKNGTVIFSFVQVGYALNRYKELIDPNYTSNVIDRSTLNSNEFKALVQLFNLMNTDGTLSLDSGSSIGSNPSLNHYNMTQTYGFRTRKNGSDAVSIADGALIGGAMFKTIGGKGVLVQQYDNDQYRMIDIPGMNQQGQLSDLEYYGYTLADFNNGSVLDFSPSSFEGKMGNKIPQMAFVMTTKKETPPPPPPYREEPDYPWIPFWFEPCCCVPCCCVQTTCAEYIPGACDPATNACDPAEGSTDSYEESGDAPAQDFDSHEQNENNIPTLAPPRPATMS